MNFNIIFTRVLIVTSLLGGLEMARAQGTAFTYQGRLNDGGAPANGSYDFRFRLASDPLANNYVGGNALTNGVPVTNGLFTVLMDFGGAVFSGSNIWLEVDVRTNGGTSYVTLNPLQQLTPTPYAITAGGASNLLNGLPAAQLTGVVQSGQLGGTYSGAVTFSNPGNSFNGTFNGNGAGLTNVWKTAGNAGTTPGPNFLGTSDNQPLEMHVNGSRVLRLEPNGNAPNVIGGANSNFVASGVEGATIAGGGTIVAFGGVYTNWIGANYDTIGGGLGNGIESNAFEATIAGGNQNKIRNGAYRSTIGGGFLNSIQTNAFESIIGGGNGNTIQTNANDSAIGGGIGNTIQTNAHNSVIAGGYFNTIQINAHEAAISGGSANLIGSVGNGFIGAGWNNIVQNSYASVVGGLFNTNSGYASVIGGGQNNTIFDQADRSVISGGGNNVIVGAELASVYDTIGGGIANVIQTNSIFSVIGGGNGNMVQTNGTYATIGGGLNNVIQTNSLSSAIGGGSYNKIRGGTNNLIAGGFNNLAGPSGVVDTNGNYASVGGGFANNAEGNYSTVPGGFANWAPGQYSFAAGHQANAMGDGDFVWADDSSGAGFSSTGSNQFLIRATGGVGIGTASPSAALHVNGAGPPTLALRISNGGISVEGAGIDTPTPAFIHQATAANIVSGSIHLTLINNPVCNGVPNAMLIVTPNWNAGGGVYDNHAIGVFYNGAQWGIFNQDFAAMPTNAAFNVLVIRP